MDGHQLVKKRQRRLPGIDEKVIALYSWGHSTRDIEAQLEELYGIELSPSLVSNITDQFKEDIQAWQARPLDPIYPIIYFDALVVKSRQDGRVKNKAVHVASSLIVKIRAVERMQSRGGRFTGHLQSRHVDRGGKCPDTV